MSVSAVGVSTSGSLLSSLLFKLKNAPGDAVSTPVQPTHARHSHCYHV